MTETIAGVTIPDSPLATEATALLREAGTTLPANHSLRSFLFGSVQGRNQTVRQVLHMANAVDPETLALQSSGRQPAAALWA